MTEKTALQDLTSAKLADLDANSIFETLAWAEKFYSLEVPKEELQARLNEQNHVKLQEPLPNVEDCTPIMKTPKIIFVINQAQLDDSFWKSSDGQLLLAIITKGLDLEPTAAECLSELEFLSYSFKHTDYRIILLGLAPQAEIELALGLPATNNKTLTWLSGRYGQIVFVPSLSTIASDAQVKKSFWGILKAIKK